MIFSVGPALNLFRLLVLNVRENCSSWIGRRLALAIGCSAVISKLREASLCGSGARAFAIDVGLRYFRPTMEKDKKKMTKAAMQAMAIPVQCCGKLSDLMTKSPR
jgi:hypothetical protein